MHALRQTLSTGCLSMQFATPLASPSQRPNQDPQQSPDHAWSADQLFGLAERQNPKRAFLFVSKVLGRHIPVSPSTMRQVYQQLAAALPSRLPEPVLFVGMAETAVGLAAGVFEAAHAQHPNSVLITSTRHPVDGELLCEFKEAHSHATDHLLYRPHSASAQRRLDQAKTLVLIDDEATTGNTFNNLTRALQQAGLKQLEQVATVTLTDWSEQSLSQALSPLPVNTVSLLQGQWHWQADPEAVLPELPPVNLTAKGQAPLSQRQDWGRLGLEAPLDATLKQLGLSLSAHTQAQLDHSPERVLVLGSGEFVYPPFLLAEALEQRGHSVKFSATSRSPIAEGLAIESRLSFSDHYGLGIANYCYNVAHQRFDRVLLCSETPASHWDAAFLSALGHIAPQVEVLEYA